MANFRPFSKIFFFHWFFLALGWLGPDAALKYAYMDSAVNERAPVTTGLVRFFGMRQVGSQWNVLRTLPSASLLLALEPVVCLSGAS